MKVRTKPLGCRSQRGVALVIALFTLMLISAVATALILMAGTASAIKGNYKSSMQAFYDAKAGLEEGRSRLWVGNPNPLNACVSKPTMPTTQVCYITNPDTFAGETTVDPTSSTDPYFDTEYDTEFGQGALLNAKSQGYTQTTASNSALTTPNIPGPAYKWVRITARTEQSTGFDVNGGSPQGDPNWQYPLFYCSTAPETYCTDGRPHQFPYSGVGAPPDGSTQVLTVTALAVTPNAGYSGRRLLQYAVAQSADPDKLGHMLDNGSGPPPMNSIFQAALTLDGNGVTYNGQPQNSNYTVNGNDASASSGVGAIGYTNSNDAPNIAAQPTQSYQSPQGVPSVGMVTLPTLMNTPPGMDSLVQQITLSANAVINPPSGVLPDQGSLPSGMTSSIIKNSPFPNPPPCSPRIAVVNGDFHLTHPSGENVIIGCGLLVVTGTLYYDPDDYWYGIILVIGKGVFDGTQSGGGGQLDGAVLVANTRNSTGKLLTTLGPASFNQTGGGKGIQYNSNAVNQSQALLSLPYQVLSFREIQLTQ